MAGSIKLPRPYVFHIARGFSHKDNRLWPYARAKVENCIKKSVLFRRKAMTFRPQLWKVRIRAACQEYGLMYNQFYKGLQAQNIRLNRVMLMAIAQQEPYTFKALCDTVQFQEQNARPYRYFADRQKEYQVSSSEAYKEYVQTLHDLPFYVEPKKLLFKDVQKEQ